MHNSSLQSTRRHISQGPKAVTLLHNGTAPPLPPRPPLANPLVSRPVGQVAEEVRPTDGRALSPTLLNQEVITGKYTEA